MKLFFDSSVLIAACMSPQGVSRAFFQKPKRPWELITCSYCAHEVQRNLTRLRPSALADWTSISGAMTIVPDALTMPYPLLFWAHKDKPVLCSALVESADVLLTWDRGDFGHLLGGRVYGTLVQTPAEFLRTLT